VFTSLVGIAQNSQKEWCVLSLFDISQKLISHFSGVFTSLFGIAQMSQKSGVFSLFI
jgi:hypothetical protein